MDCSSYITGIVIRRHVVFLLPVYQVFIQRNYGGKMSILDKFFLKKVDPLVRPIDQSIATINKELSKWNSHQRKEIISTLMKKEWSEKHHIHQNPKRKELPPAA